MEITKGKIYAVAVIARVIICLLLANYFYLPEYGVNHYWKSLIVFIFGVEIIYAAAFVFSEESDDDELKSQDEVVFYFLKSLFVIFITTWMIIKYITTSIYDFFKGFSKLEK